TTSGSDPPWALRLAPSRLRFLLVGDEPGIGASVAGVRSWPRRIGAEAWKRGGTSTTLFEKVVLGRGGGPEGRPSCASNSSPSAIPPHSVVSTIRRSRT